MNSLILYPFRNLVHYSTSELVQKGRSLGVAEKKCHVEYENNRNITYIPEYAVTTT